MQAKVICGLGSVLLVLCLNGCRKAEEPKKAAARKPVDASKPLAPQLFPTPATNNIWFHVITTSDELKFNPKLSPADEVIDLSKSTPKQRATFFGTEPAKSLVANLVSLSSLTATSPRSEKLLADSVMVPPDFGRFRAVARFLTAAMVTASEQRNSRLATDIAVAALRIAQAPASESNAGIATSLACEILILTELCRIASTLTPDDLETIANNQLLPSALNKSRFTSGLRSDYAIIESLLASDDILRAAGLYLKAVALHKRTEKWPRDIAALGSGYDILEPLTGKPFILSSDAAGGVRIRASKGMPVVFGVSRGELSVGKTLQLGNASK